MKIYYFDIPASKHIDILSGTEYTIFITRVRFLEALHEQITTNFGS